MLEYLEPNFAYTQDNNRTLSKIHGTCSTRYPFNNEGVIKFVFAIPFICRQYRVVGITSPVERCFIIQKSVVFLLMSSTSSNFTPGMIYETRKSRQELTLVSIEYFSCLSNPLNEKDQELALNRQNFLCLLYLNFDPCNPRIPKTTGPSNLHS